MNELVFDETFDVDDVTEKINHVMSKWSIHFLDINGPNWIVYNYEMEVKYVFQFTYEKSW